MQFDDASPSGSAVEIEKEANDFAGRLLIPFDAEAELMAISSSADASGLADRLGVAPGIVAGRY
jgi:Zn-dependent peptidase ImmA (M78 family)